MRAQRQARLLICCGEPSGDLYAGELVRHLKLQCPDIEVTGLGGDHLAAQGVPLLAHVRELAVVGLLEVLAHLRRIRGIFYRVLEEVDRARPDAAVLIDYPDFNLRLARELKRRGIPVIYYVSPQIWAWRGGRIKAIHDSVARMLVIFPFEERLYAEAGVPVRFVGHPLVELVRPAESNAAFLAECGLDPERPLVSLLPGSRPREVSFNLPPLVEAVRGLRAQRPELQFAAAVAPSLDAARIADRLGGAPVRLVQGRTHALVGAARVAVVASGTATVETALLGTPMVVVYRLSALTYLLGRPFVRLRSFSMVNLIAERPVVTELIQGALTPENVQREVLTLLDDRARIDQMRRDLDLVRARLGQPGASARAAAEILPFLAPEFTAGHPSVPS